MKVGVIGAGIFGCSIAYELRKRGHDVLLYDRNPEIMREASQNNHNRIHFGYHYPRSVITAKQSLDGLVSFFTRFRDAIVTDFPNYYAIAKEGSKVSAHDFKAFCDEVGITAHSESPGFDFVDPQRIEDCFRVDEPVFSFTELRYLVQEKIDDVTLHLGYNIQDIETTSDGSFILKGSSTKDGKFEHEVSFLINASYSGLNQINEMIGTEPLDLTFEDVEIPIFKMNLPNIGLTIMDGPFCTIMPKADSKNEFLLYHVTESVYKRSKDIEVVKESNKKDYPYRRRGQFDAAVEYFPFLEKVCDNPDLICGAYRAIRTVNKNASDARVSEIHTYKTHRNYLSVLSGKISTAVQIAIHVAMIVDGDYPTTRYIV